MPPESYEEFRAKTSIDGQGSGASDPTRNAREAGAIYRRNREWLAEGGIGGEVEIERRTITVGPWQPVEKERVEPRPNG